MRHRLFTAFLVGSLGAIACYYYQISFNRGAGDITWPLCAGHALLVGRDPYECEQLMSTGQPGPTNPLTTAIVTLPLTVLLPELAAATFIGLSSALLAFGLTRNYEWWRLFVFLAFPYWAALQTVQWSPLLFAVALYPALLPLTLAKPHVGLPIALTHLTKLRLLTCVVFGLATLLLDPDWPWHWIGQVGTYDGFVPLLTLPGPLLVLAVPWWRDKRAQVCLLLAAVPQRLFYDQLLVWLVPKTQREMLLLTCLSWLGYFGAFYTGRGATAWMITAIYLPALIMIVSGQVEKDTPPVVATRHS